MVYLTETGRTRLEALSEQEGVTVAALIMRHGCRSAVTPRTILGTTSSKFCDIGHLPSRFPDPRWRMLSTA